MNLYAGIDLGSTTTKAVLLDEDEQVVGRGITNSRSNYDVAAGVARAEALIDARFQLLRRALSRVAALGEGEKLDGFLKRLERSFRLEQHLGQLQRLRDLAFTESGRRPGEQRASLETALGTIFTAMDSDAKRLYLFGESRRSDFFRDLAGSHYQHAAERLAKQGGTGFEALMGIFDKTILVVENEPLELGFAASLARALGHAIAQAGLKDSAAAGEIERHAREAVDSVLDEKRVIGTGYGRQRLPFPKDCIRSEILCHGLGAHHMFPKTATVLDIGGQDTKAIQVDDNGIVTSFQMNDRCAAGCGRYLGYIADEMNLGLQELGPLALESKNTVRINSTCTVFAGAELRDRLMLGQKREDILAGLHRAIILRAMSLLARSGGIKDEFTFTGGVAKNPAAVRALSKLVAENYGERRLNISADSIYTGALGAALFARRDSRKEERAA